MSRGKVVPLPSIAAPTIEKVLDEFLTEERGRLSPKTARNYEHVIDLLKSHLDGYGHEFLSEGERALFEIRYNAEGDEHREFCQIFGPEKIPVNVGGFLGYFMIRKVVAGEDLKRAAGTVTKRLMEWLAEKGYADSMAAKDRAGLAARGARDLPKAERAARILAEAGRGVNVDMNELDEKDRIEFDHFPIAKIEPGRLWLENYGEGPRHLGPIAVPKEATSLLQEGWSISCSLVRIRGRWRIVEAANVYPL